MAVLRELTKLYESIYRGTVTDVLSFMQQDTDRLRGEFVIVLEGASPSSEGRQQGEMLSADKILAVLLEELPVKQAAGIAARLTGLPRNQLYKQALERKED